MLPCSLAFAQPKIISLGDFTEDIRITSTVRCLFGADLATGDFNGDGYDDVLIGAYAANSDEGNSVGKAYILFGGQKLPSFIDYNKASPFLTVIHGDDPLDYTGRWVASGDVNGDGIDDAIIGAPQLFQFTIGAAGRGRVYIVYGRRDWPQEISLDTDGAAIAGVTRIAGKAREHFAGKVACGDVNGDGFFDVVIGAFGAGPPGDFGNEGEAYIVYGSDTLAAVIELQNMQSGITTIQGTQNAQIGSWIRCFDLDGDAFMDLFIGQPKAQREDGTGINAGKAYIIYGAEAFPEVIDLDESTYRKTVIIGTHRDEIGWEFDVGDINGDGILDLLLATELRAKERQYRSSHGKMYVLMGKSNHLPVIDLKTYNDKLVIWGRDIGTERLPADQLGQELVAGDFNADGFTDILTSATNAHISGPITGECYIINGSANIAEKKEWRVYYNEHHVEIRGYQEPQELGNALAVGDLNGDGIDDMILGASYTSSTHTHLTGAVFVLYGRKEGEPLEEVPDTAEMQPSYPNPFNGFTILPYTVREQQHITLKVFNATGQLVRTLVDSEIEPGTHRAIWEGEDEYFEPVSSGVYFAWLVGKNFSQARKILFLK